MGKDLLDPDDVSAKLVELKDRSRRDKLRIDGFQETPNETWKTCQEKAQEILKNNLDLTEVEIDRCHRVKSRNQSSQHQARRRSIICQFNNFKDKQQSLNNGKKLRDTGIYIYEDFSKDTMSLLKTLGRKYYSIEDKINLPISIIEAS